LNPSHLKNRTHCSTGNDTGTLRRRLHIDFRRAVPGIYRMLESRSCQINTDHVSFCRLKRLLNSQRDFTRLPSTKSDSPITITDNCNGCEAKYSAALNNFSYTVNFDKFFLKAICLAPVFLLISLFFVLARHENVSSITSDQTDHCILNLKAGFARSFRHRFHPAMIAVTGSVKSHLFYTFFKSSRPNKGTNLLRSFNITGLVVTKGLLKGTCSRKNLPTMNDLRVDVL
jgi:hypothetical protein